MATSSTLRHLQLQSHYTPSNGNNGNDVSNGSVLCPAFPDTFKEFFTSIRQDDDNAELLATMLEDKLIPRRPHSALPTPEKVRWETAMANKKLGRRGTSVKCTSYSRRSSDARRHHGDNKTTCAITQPPISPIPVRRRSSSIAVTRTPPDLHRFLQGEQQLRPWSHYHPTSEPLNSGAISPVPGPLTAAFPGYRGRYVTSTMDKPEAMGHLFPTQDQNNQPSRPVSPLPSPSPGGPRNRYIPAVAQPELGHFQQKHVKAQYRTRTASMPPAVPRHRPTLAEIRRAALAGTNPNTDNGTCNNGSGSDDVEYYRLRSFSITANGVFNLGDSLRSRRSRSINSVTSSGSERSRDRFPSNASQTSGADLDFAEGDESVPCYKVGMLGSSGVGKTALTYQFTTSEYICAYDASLDDEYGQKTVSVMLDGQETELEIIDHPASEMSVEAFCATYNVDVFVVVYSVVDRGTFQKAEETLRFLRQAELSASKAVILVANKADLERKREVPIAAGRRLANNMNSKFIETSSGLDHNVDELLVGILAQVKLNPKREKRLLRQRRRASHGAEKSGAGASLLGSTRFGSSGILGGKASSILGGSCSSAKEVVHGGGGVRLLKHFLAGFRRKARSCENLFVL